MLKKTLLTSAILGAIAMTAGTTLVGAAERSCSTTYAKKYFAECGGSETREEPRVRVMEKYPTHPFYGDRVANGSMQPGTLTPIGSVQADDGTNADLENALRNSPTIIDMQTDIANNTAQAEDNASRIGLNSDRLDADSDRISDNRVIIDDHGRRIVIIEDQITGLSQAPAYWGPSDSETGEFRRVDDQVADETVWTPPITTQTGDFTQSRDVTEVFERLVTEYEENAITGERRVSGTYMETEERTRTEERLVDAANNPAGGTDGYSAWANVGGVYSCSSYSPARSTVDEGQRFTQTRTCLQNQERFIYYLADGLLQTQNRQTRAASVNQSRSTTGTRPTEPDFLTLSCAPGDALFSNSNYFSAPTLSPSRQWEFVQLLGAGFAIGSRAPTQANPYRLNGQELYAGNYYVPTAQVRDTYEVCVKR